MTWHAISLVRLARRVIVWASSSGKSRNVTRRARPTNSGLPESLLSPTILTLQESPKQQQQPGMLLLVPKSKRRRDFGASQVGKCLQFETHLEAGATR
jgi:hypothetical protein